MSRFMLPFAKDESLYYIRLGWLVSGLAKINMLDAVCDEMIEDVMTMSHDEVESMIEAFEMYSEMKEVL